MSDETPTEQMREAALAAALAVKAAGPAADVAVVAANIAAEQGMSPHAAVSIGSSLRRAVAMSGIDAAASSENVDAAARAAAGTMAGPGAASGAEATTVSPAPGPQPASAPDAPKLSRVESERLNRALSAVSGWVPLSQVAGLAGIDDLDTIRAVLNGIDHDFVVVTDDNVFVTENGRRFVEYRSLAGGSY